MAVNYREKQYREAATTVEQCKVPLDGCNSGCEKEKIMKEYHEYCQKSKSNNIIICPQKIIRRHRYLSHQPNISQVQWTNDQLNDYLTNLGEKSKNGKNNDGRNKKKKLKKSKKKLKKNKKKLKKNKKKSNKNKTKSKKNKKKSKKNKKKIKEEQEEIKEEQEKIKEEQEEIKDKQEEQEQMIKMLENRPED